MRRSVFLSGLVLLLVAHQSSWNWRDPALFLGVPVGLLFHVLLCLAAAVLFIFVPGSSSDSDL